MADKIYCDRSVKYLLWIIAILFIATIVGMVYYPDAVEIESSDSRSTLPVLSIPKTARSIARAAGNPSAQQAIQAQPAALAVNPDAPASPLPLQNIQGHLNNVASTVKPSVVHIHVLRIVPGGGEFGNTQVDSIGSGVLVDPSGHVLTNYHVVENPLRISVTTYSRAGSDTYQAELIDSDARAGLAVIRIQGANFPAASLGDSSSLQVGDWVMAMGSPLDLAQTVSLGIVSAVRGAVRIGGTTYFDLIQTDAHINKGNSGGPLVDMYGQVVGINAAIYTPEGRFTGVGFALPINSAKAMLNDLNIGQERFVPRAANPANGGANPGPTGGWLGVQGVSLAPEMAARQGVPADQGVYVTQVLADSPALAAGLQPGDTILWMNNTRITGTDSLRSALAVTPPGPCVLRVRRAGQVWDVSAAPRGKP